MAILMHGHHAGSLFTVGRELGERVEQIKREKPVAEQALRLALIQDVTALLPQTKARAAHDEALAALDKAWAALDKARAALDNAWAALDKARAALDKAWAALDKARAAYDKARTAFDEALAAHDEAWTAYVVSFDTEAFHREHCHPNCPWDGKTIFAKGTSIEVLEG